MIEELKLIPIALRDFALPVPRAGSIEVHSGYGRAAVEGREIHIRVQKKRAKFDPTYEAEISLSQAFDRDRYRFRIDGRMDGIFRHDPPKIEEIKTSFNIRELAHRLAGDRMAHPYCLQLMTYGYFYWIEHRVLPVMSFHLVSTRSGESFDFELALDLPEYEKWIELRLDELVRDVKKAEKRYRRRRKIASVFPFPFERPRSGQIELMHAIDQGVHEGNPMLIQAPTGLGKTVGVLYPVLKEALGRGQKVVYVTPKNSQHAVAEDAVTRFQDAGAKLKCITITAKGKICFKNEPLCNPDYCEYARDYYSKVFNHGILDLLAKKRKLKAMLFRDLGEEYQVCPFELQFDCAQETDIVICDYNYVFAPRSSFGHVTELGIHQKGKPNLVIDEAHNLPSRSMDYYSPALSSITLEQMRSETRTLAPRFRVEVEELLASCIQVIVTCTPDKTTGPMKINPAIEPFLEQDSRLRAFLSRYLDSDVTIQPRDVVMRLCFYWSEFTEALGYVGDPDHQEFFTTFHPHATGGIIKITCCDASAMLTNCYDEYEQVVGFSATLKPFDYYAKLAGLDSRTVKKAEFPSPFPKDNRKLLIIPQISTKYSDREHNYPRISDAIRRIAALRSGNYFAFFPSFEFLEKVLDLFDPPEGFTVLRQEREMKAMSLVTMLQHLKDGNSPTIVFAVQGGMLSEGVDYPGDTVIGAFVVGPPLPVYDLEREQMREYYDRKYGSGFDYAYTIPAMAKAIQSAGRVIRSETDRGLIVLMDNRFVQPGYSQSMPSDWFESAVIELVSTSIVKEVSAFWTQGFSR